MKLEVKLLFLAVCLFLIIQPMVLNAKELKSGDRNYKDPIIALVLGIILPGLGHIWVGETSKGLMYLAIYLVASVLFWIFIWFLWFAVFIFGIWVAIDGMNLAKKYNERGGKLSLVDHFAPAVNTAY